MKGFILCFLTLISNIWAGRHLINENSDINQIIQEAQSGDTLVIMDDIIVKQPIIITKNIVIDGGNDNILSFLSGEYMLQGENLDFVKIENITLAAMMGSMIDGLLFLDNVKDVTLTNVKFLSGFYHAKISQASVKIENCQFNYTITKSLHMENINGEITGTTFDSESNCLSVNGITKNASLLIDSCFFVNGLNHLSISDNGDAHFKVANTIFQCANDSTPPNFFISIDKANGTICNNKFLYSGSKTAVTVFESNILDFHHNILYSDNYSGTTRSIFSNNVDSLNIINNTIYNFSEVVMSTDCHLRFINNISTGPSKEAISIKGTHQAEIRYNNFYGFSNPPYSGNVDPNRYQGNIFIDPSFISTSPVDTNDFLCLQCNSPCINAGDPEFDPGEEDDAIIDQGFTGGTDRGCGNVTPIQETVRQKNKREIDIFPQPATLEIHFSLTGTEKINEALIFDLTGAIIFKSHDLPSFLNISSWPSGVYFLLVKSQNKLYKEKFTIIH